jgi:hypothetical protein
MATKKKAKKGTKSKPTSGKKLRDSKRPAKKKPSKKLTRKKKVSSSSRKPIKTAKSSRQNATRKNSPRAVFEPRRAGARADTQAGDLQGLSDIEAADSESVSELLDEGNAFEADVVAGVEQADDDGVREVHTHEVPEDDVPEEYLDKD